METAELVAEPRTKGGTRAARRLRREGKIPAIIYGHEQKPEMVSLVLHDVLVALHHGARVLRLKIDGRTEQLLVKDVQYDYLDATPIHVDLARVSLDERVTVTVPIEVRRTPKGVREGGVLDQMIGDIEVECVVTQIPEVVRVNVNELGLGQALHVRDLQLAEGVVAQREPDEPICIVRQLGAEVEEAEAEAEAETGAAEPEVITRRKEEESEGK